MQQEGTFIAISLMAVNMPTISTIHGVGRAMGNGSGEFRKTGICKRPGNVTPTMMQDAVATANVELAALAWTIDPA